MHGAGPVGDGGLLRRIGRGARRRPALIALVVVALGAGAFFFTGGGSADNPSYRLAKVERGAISSKVSASGTLNAVVTVTVGSQVSGKIKELDADFNTEVKAGQVIARIDPSQFEAAVSQAEADLLLARANVSNARAGVTAAQAEIDRSTAAQQETKKDLERKKTLMTRGVYAQSVVDTAVAADEQAVATLNSAKAKLEQQQAAVETSVATVAMKEAVLSQKKIDLDNSIIRSPVDGVVIGRSVDVGQTVAASLQAPVLFTIAQDLRKMQVEVSVDEADIGRIREGQPTSFTVDSFPGHNFPGTVTQIRKAPTVVQNVVTYTVVVSADNPSLQLLPGMTANVQVMVDERPNALKIANAALRYRPAGATAEAQGGATAEPQQAPGGGAGGPPNIDALLQRMTQSLALTDDQQKQIRAIMTETRDKIVALRQQGVPPEDLRTEAQRAREASQQAILAVLTDAQRDKYQAARANRQAQTTRRGTVWVVGSDGKPEAVAIVTGISDGAMTEIVRGPLKEGQAVIVGSAAAAGGASQSRGPRLGF
ncbi:MAG: efflux RND transporter periplasmic adaptor subunit [Candidatus Eiseniibacteriota bacterium]